MRSSVLFGRAVRTAVTGVLVGSLVATTGASPATAAPASVSWAQEGYGPGNTGYNPRERVITAATVGRLDYRWSILSPVVPRSCPRQAPPVVAGGRLFLADQRGFGAYSAGTGRRIWRHGFSDPGDAVTPTLAVVGNILLVASSSCASVSDPDGDLTAYDAATGVVRWSRHRDAPMYRMVVDGDVIAVGGADAGADVVSAYRLGDGAELWNRDGARLTAGVSARGRLLLTRADHSGTDAVSIATGAVRWSTTKEWSPVAADLTGQRFFVTDPAGALLAVDAATGAVRWTATGAGGAVAVTADRVYAANGEHLVALRADNGGPVWDQDMYGTVGRPIVAGSILYVTVGDRYLEILDPGTGETVVYDWQIVDVVDHAVVVDGRLYVTSGRVLDTYTTS